MARKTDGDKIDELEKQVSALTAQLDNAIHAITDLQEYRAEMAQALNDLRRESERDIAVLKREIQEIQRRLEKHDPADVKSEVNVLKEKVTKIEGANDKFGNRAWTIVPPIISAIVSGLIAAAVAYFIAKK